MIRRFFEQANLYHKGRRAAFNREEFLLLQVGYPLVTLIFYCLIASFSFKTSNLTSWVVGNSFLLCTNSCIFGLGSIFVAERFTGRLRSLIASPCKKLPLILASGVYPAIFALASSILGLIVGSQVFSVDFSNINLYLVAITILIAMVSASCFGLFLSLIGLMSDSMHLILNVVSYILLIFTGAQFPISQLPLLGRMVSKLLPLTNSISAMKILFKPDQSLFWTYLAKEALNGVMYIIGALLLYKYAEITAKKQGKFDLF